MNYTNNYITIPKNMSMSVIITNRKSKKYVYNIITLDVRDFLYTLQEFYVL